MVGRGVLARGQLKGLWGALCLLLLSACTARAPGCDLSAVHLIYLEPPGASPTLAEPWLARRCAGILTVTDGAALAAAAEAAPGALLLVHREAAPVLAEPWMTEAYAAGSPIAALDMSMSEFDAAAPFVRVPVMAPVRRPGQLLWAGVCQREGQMSALVSPLTDGVAALLAWGAQCG